MDWSKFGNIASVSSFALAAFLAVYQYWTEITGLGIWNKFPLLLIGLGILASIATYIFPSKKADRNNEDYLNWQHINKKIIQDKKFYNEKVILDGHSYIGCVFENVTFEYLGKVPFDFSHNTITGNYQLSCKGDPLNAMITILKTFNYFKPEILFHNKNDSASEILSTFIIDAGKSEIKKIE